MIYCKNDLLLQNLFVMHNKTIFIAFKIHSDLKQILGYLAFERRFIKHRERKSDSERERERSYLCYKNYVFNTCYTN